MSDAARPSSSSSDVIDAVSDADDASTGGSSTRRWIAIGLVGAALIALAIPKISTSDDGGASAGGADAPLGVDALVLQPTSIVERIETTGTLRANESVELTGEAAGKVTSINFTEGRRVAKGDLLVQINDSELQAERQRLEYRMKLASDRAERQERILAKGGISQEEYDATVNEVNVLQSELALVKAQIEKTKVRAPFDGTVGLRQISEGSYLSPQTVITTLQDVNPIKVDLSVPEKYVLRIDEGKTVTFTVRGTDQAYEGRVYAVEPRVDANTRSLRLRARAPNASGQLRPGMFADVTVVLGTVDSTLVVPTFSVLPELGTQRVFVVSEGQAQPRNVTLGVRTDSTVQITGGLAPGDTLITSGIQNLRAGLPVRVDALDRAVPPGNDR